MTEQAAPYHVAYAERVRQRLKVLADEAARRGDRKQFAAALKEFDRRLRIYPQFGDALFNLKNERGQVCQGIVEPLLMHYTIFEDRRLVGVAILPILLPMRD